MESWGYLSGLLRSEKVHALTNNDFTSFAETVNADSLLKSLEDTVYGPLFQGRTLKEFSVIFDEYYQQKFQNIKEISPCPIVMQVHSLKVDLNNLKLCYKAKLSQKNLSWEQLSEEGTIAPERMFSIVEHELWNELPTLVARAIMELADNDSARKVDFLLDRAYYAYRLQILQQACSFESDFYKGLVDLYKKEIDCENIKNIFRAKKMNLERDQIAEIVIAGGYMSAEFFVDYANISGEEMADLIRESAYGEVLSSGINYWVTHKSCTILEKQIDEYLLDCASDFDYLSSGPAVIEESLRSMQIEIKNLKLIIIGKINNMSTEEIKERVRNVRV